MSDDISDNPVVDWRIHNGAVKTAARTLHAYPQKIDGAFARLQEAVEKFRADYAVHVQHNAELVESSREFGMFSMMQFWAEDIVQTCKSATYTANTALNAGTKKNMEARSKPFHAESCMTDPYEKACYEADKEEYKEKTR